MVTSTLEETKRGGGDVEVGDVVLIDDIPVPREVGVRRGTLENDGGHTEEERSVDDIGMASDPTDVTTTEVDITGVEVEDILAGGSRAYEVASGGVHDTLGLAGRARSVEKEHGVLRVDGRGGNVGRPLLGLLVPPRVTALGPGDLGTGALVDEDVLDVGALLQGVVDDLLGANELATTSALVGGDDNLGIGVDDAVAEGVGGETGEDDGVDGADTNASKEGDDGLGNHGEVDGDGVTLSHTHLLEDPGGLGDLAEELAISDATAITGFVGFVNDGDLVGVLESMTVDAVVRGIELALDEPGYIAGGEGAGANGLEVLGPVEELSGFASPELVRLTDGLLVEPLVVLHT